MTKKVVVQLPGDVVQVVYAEDDAKVVDFFSRDLVPQATLRLPIETVQIDGVDHHYATIYSGISSDEAKDLVSAN